MTGSYFKLMGQMSARGFPVLESGIGGGEEADVKAVEIRQSLFVEQGQMNRSPMFQSTFDRLKL